MRTTIYSSTIRSAAVDSTSLVKTDPSYEQRPDLQPPTFEIELEDLEHVTAGFYFAAPWQDLPLQNGPYIFDSTGELVWSGYGLSGAANAHGLFPCQYRDAIHLCFSQGNQDGTSCE